MRPNQLILPFLCLLLFFSCQDKKTSTNKNDLQSIERYLLEHSPTHVSVKDIILLRFRSDYDGADIAAGATITPQVAGDFVWEEGNALRFKPESQLDYDTEYQISVALPDQSDKLHWHFATTPLSFRVQNEGLNITSDGTVFLPGRINTSDYVAPDVVEERLKATQAGNDNITIEWEHGSGGREHRYVVRGIAQTDAESEVDVRFSGEPYSDFDYEREVTVLPKGDFQFLAASTSDVSERRVQLQFSSPIDSRQNLNGLITIDKQKKAPRILVDDNLIYVYPSATVDGSFKIYVSDQLRSTDGKTLGKETLLDMRFDMADPELKLLGRGTIIPSSQSAIFAIESINLKEVDVEIVKIYDDNVLQFLQQNKLNESGYIQPVGRIMWRDRIEIPDADQNVNKWLRVGIDLRKYLADDPGALYQVRVGYQQAYAMTDCDKAVEPRVYRGDDESMMTYRYDYYYHYDDRDNPCSRYYYSPNRFVQRNVLLSDVGVITKRGRDGSYSFAITDISTGEPLSGAKVRLYDYQQQLLVSSVTSGDGLLTSETERPASFAVVEHAKGYAYVRYQDQEANSLSEFDVAGVQKSLPIDGYIYTDRGVYRPGDTIYLNFMLEDMDQPLPARHPVSLKVTDPKGANKYQRTTSDNVGKIYSFAIPTAAADRTGSWRAEMRVGEKSFYKKIRVEAIKPNRLKINLEHPEVVQLSPSTSLDLESQWLYGAPASGLNAHVEARLTNSSTKFNGYDGYTFTDPTREGLKGLQNWYKGSLNNQGQTQVPIKVNTRDIPGKVRASVKTRVFEPSGNFSEDFSSFTISPFESYVGVSVPKNRWGYSSVMLGEDAQFEVVALTPDGQPIANRELTVGFYNTKWEWWYYRSYNRNLYRLNSAEHKEAFYKVTVKTDSRGRAIVNANIESEGYGRKLIRVCDPVTGHCSGDKFYASSYGSSSQEQNRESLAQLQLSTDKSQYEVGDEVQLTIPSEAGSKMLISIEDAQEVIYQEWITGKKDQTTYKLKVNEAMSPNVYAHVTMVQAYDTKQNDLPIRMYGVVPINVDDPKTILSPEIAMNDKLEPEQTFDISVSEEDGRPMSYTIAIVDEGLLDLTHFATPAPHGHFYAHRSLGVNTWDIYNDVLTGVNGEVDKMISVGGDGTAEDGDGSKKPSRFKPVVMTAGPFALDRGERKKHTFTMPNYMGSVRAMVVARQDESYGHTDKTVPVKSPVMVLPTMPRVLSPGEEVSIPVSVFATEENVKDVKVSIEVNDKLQLISPAAQSVRFSQVGDQLVHFKARVTDAIGTAQVRVSATGGRHKAYKEIELDVRNPNPYTSDTYQTVIAAGDSWTFDAGPHGVDGTNSGTIELSTFPQINLEKRLGSLMRYPYGCVEQTTSSVMPQLYLSDMMELSAARSQRVKRNISAGIRRLTKMQTAKGGFAYWPGRYTADDWGTSYAGHFLIEADKKGYAVRSDVINKWTDYQRKAARSFKTSSKDKKWKQNRDQLAQAYRLYTLALHGTPELSAMNVLKLNKSLPNVSRYLLAAAYALSGKKNSALELIKGLSTEVKSYRELSTTYGSDVRDRALIAQALMLVDHRNQAGHIIKDLADELSSRRWYSTQSLGQSLSAIGTYLATEESGTVSADVAIPNATEQKIVTDKTLYVYTYDPDQGQGKITNTGNTNLYVTVLSAGQKPTAEIETIAASNSNISIDVKYTDMSGNAIDPSSLTRGTDFMAVTTVRNLKTRGTWLREMALSQVFPAGWEIQSGGLSNTSDAIKEDTYEYRDVRDDRVYTFFDLRDKMTYRTRLTATYDGEYLLPPTECHAMYDDDISARSSGQRVSVKPPTE